MTRPEGYPVTRRHQRVVERSENQPRVPDYVQQQQKFNMTKYSQQIKLLTTTYKTLLQLYAATAKVLFTADTLDVSIKTQNQVILLAVHKAFSVWECTYGLQYGQQT